MRDAQSAGGESHYEVTSADFFSATSNHVVVAFRGHVIVVEIEGTPRNFMGRRERVEFVQ